MEKTVLAYKAFIEDVKSELGKIWTNCPERDRNDMANKIAASLSYSQTTVLNYFRGMISSTETALTILEKHKELFING